MSPLSPNYFFVKVVRWHPLEPYHGHTLQIVLESK